MKTDFDDESLDTDVPMQTQKQKSLFCAATRSKQKSENQIFVMTSTISHSTNGCVRHPERSEQPTERTMPHEPIRLSEPTKSQTDTTLAELKRVLRMPPPPV